MVLLSIWNFKNRMYDWDMPGYMGCFYTLIEPNNPKEIHQRIYQEIKKEAPEKEYIDIIGINLYDRTRQWFTKSEQSFTEQLPYFQIKIGYNITLLALYKIGFTGPMSVTILSVISYFISGILLFFVLKTIFPNKPWLSSLLTVGICLLSPMTHMAQISTPDMFIFQFMMLFMIALLRRWNQWAMFIIQFLIVFVRPDYITFSLTFYITQSILEYLNTKKINYLVIIQCAILVTMYIAILKYYNYPGWKALFYDTFIYRRPFISKEKADFTISKYLNIFFGKLLYFKKVTLSCILMLTGIFCFSKDKFIRFFAICFVVNIYIKFALFPQSAALRFFFPFIALLLFMFFYSVNRKYPNLKIGKIA